MYEIENQEAAEKIESYSPCYSVQLKNTSTDDIYAGNSIFSVNSDLQSASQDDIELGAVCSQSWKVRLNGTDNFLGQEYKLGIYLKEFSSELIPMGTFTCVKCRKSGGSTELTGADKLYFSDRPYTLSENIKLPASSQDIEDDICAQLGVENGNNYYASLKLSDCAEKRLFDSNGLRIKTANFDFKISSIPEKATMRQMLSYIASAQGQFGFVDRFGRYVRKWYRNPVKTIDDNTVDIPTISEKANRIVGIVCKANNNTYSDGDITGETGRVINFQNPFMTESLFKTIYHRLVLASDFEWYTAEIKQRLGDPRFDIGDVINYSADSGRTYLVPVMNLSFSFDGGLSADISAVGLSPEEEML